MRAIERFFTQTPMAWPRVIILALVCGIIPGLLMVPEFLDGTSLRQPGISYEFWVFMGMFIAMNCQRPLEAGLKVFVFFLISQPVIYLVQVPFCWLGWGIFSYYLNWIIPTILTFPAGMLVWYLRKANWLCVAALALPCAILALELPAFALGAVQQFPKLVLATLFILAQLVIYPLLVFRDPKKRVAMFAIILALVAGFTVWTTNQESGIYSTGLDAEGPAPQEIISDNPRFEVEAFDGAIQVTARMSDIQEPGEDVIEYRDADGVTHRIRVTYGDGRMYVENVPAE